VIAVAAAVAVLLIWRPWAAREGPASATEAAAPAPRTEEPARPPVAEPPARMAPAEETRTPAGAPGPESKDAAVRTPAQSSSGALALASAELCQTFSTGGDSWRCDAAGSEVPPGPLVLYTRVKSASDGAVVHRWYRGETLRQSVRLTTRANATQGYRTYSRQTVADGDWRVEVRSGAGELLHEQRFSVR
jgi:hypothetical protein